MANLRNGAAVLNIAVRCARPPVFDREGFTHPVSAMSTAPDPDKTEKEKMLAGALYNPLDPELSAARERCRALLKAFNGSDESEREERARLLAELLGYPSDVTIQPPFFCDYGTNLRLGAKVFFNFNCVVLDVMAVVIGDRTLIGPAVQIYTATHPLDAVERRSREFARPVTIGADVWIGGGAIICPGVTVGDRTIIGAGSVVTKPIPPDVIAAGNPARVIRRQSPA
jgi:maltose O-acetyltransferase